MPITSIDSYKTTGLEIENSWTDADAVLAPETITLMGGYTRANFHTERLAIGTTIDDVLAKLRAELDAATVYESLKLDMLHRPTQFRFQVLSKVVDPNFRAKLPGAPGIGMEVSKFLKPFKELVIIWQRINDNLEQAGLDAPLTLQGGYTLAQCRSDIATLQTLADAWVKAVKASEFSITQRDNALKAFYQRMLQYRQGVQGSIARSNPVYVNLPRITPKPGTKPKPLVVTGVWDAALQKVVLTWPAAVGADIQKLQVRGCTGGKYNTGREEVIADLSPDATRWEGDWALTVPGSVACFKVYVMTTTGNENGGQAVKIIRPVPEV